MTLPLVTTIGSARVGAGVNSTMNKSKQSPPKILDMDFLLVTKLYGSLFSGEQRGAELMG